MPARSSNVAFFNWNNTNVIHLVLADRNLAYVNVSPFLSLADRTVIQVVLGRVDDLLSFQLKIAFDVHNAMMQYVEILIFLSQTYSERENTTQIQLCITATRREKKVRTHEI